MAKPELTPRVRVETALEHQEPDRVPWDLAATGQTGLRVEAQDQLLAYWKIGERTERPLDPIARIALPHPALVERYPPDVVGFRPTLAPLQPEDEEAELEERYDWDIEISVDGGAPERPAQRVERIQDGWGIRWTRTEGEPILHPETPPLIEVETLQEVLEYPIPDPEDSRQWEPYTPPPDQAALLGGWGRGFLETALLLFGPKRVYADWLRQEGFTEALWERLLEGKLRYWQAHSNEPEVQESPPLLLLETERFDLMESLPIAPELFREHLAPFWRRLIAAVRDRYPNSRFFLFARSYHFSYVGDLIEMGVELLPLIPDRIADASSVFLKREFGSSLTFVGGGPYTPEEFLRGTPEQAADQVKRTLDLWAPDGGYLWAPFPVVEAEVPPENLVAALDTLFRYGLY